MSRKNTITFTIIFLFSILVSGCTTESTTGPGSEDVATEALCRYWWVAQYVESGNTDVTDEIVFNPDGTGSEIITRYQSGRALPPDEYSFYWYWHSNSYRAVRLEYPQTTLYMDNLYIANNILTCKMAGMNMTFFGE